MTVKNLIEVLSKPELQEKEIYLEKWVNDDVKEVPLTEILSMPSYIGEDSTVTYPERVLLKNIKEEEWMQWVL